ncbi:MAG: hypothetical protein GY804_02420 [Alphaproteobacteria bacterium]|nr:hypothetical protein [Alphaproteobacteria bacterium]
MNYLKRLYQQYMSGWKAMNNKKYVGYWIDRKKPLNSVQIIILREFNNTQKAALYDWLRDYIPR